MAGNVINGIPEFTKNETVDIEEVKEAAAEEVVEEVKETPTELPAEEKPAQEEQETSESDDTGENVLELKQAVQGLQDEKVKLLKELQDLRGSRREIKQVELEKVQDKIDELKDLHPDDVNTIDRVIRAKGFVTQKEASQMFYKAVQDEELNKFLAKYPEYKPENDSNDLNWNSLQKELSFYRMPVDPHQMAEVLERAHKSILRVSGDRSLSLKKRQVQTASVGSGGTPRSSSPKITLDSDRKAMLRQGGFTEEDIAEMEKRME